MKQVSLTYGISRLAYVAKRGKLILHRALVILLCVSLFFAGLGSLGNPVETSSECNDAMQVFQVGCFISCTQSDAPAPKIKMILETGWDPGYRNGSENFVAKSVPPDSCFCCSNRPIRDLVFKARLSDSSPSQRILPVLAIDAPPAFFKAGLGMNSSSGFVGDSHHLPYHATIVIIV